MLGVGFFAPPWLSASQGIVETSLSVQRQKRRKTLTRDLAPCSRKWNARKIPAGSEATL